MSYRIKGVLSPVVTPFDKDLGVDLALFTAQCRWLQANHVGLAFLGTNSEANSIGPDERMDMIDALIQAKLDPRGMMPGTGACDLPTVVRLTQRAVQSGCAGVLMLPPFYYKGVSDEGLYRYYSEVIQRVGDERLRIYLYHIPPVAQVPISLGLIDRLLRAYPGIVAGVKDSSGDWSNTQAMLERFAPLGFDVFAGSETFLLQTLRHGGAGCISATANVNAAAIHALYRGWQEPGADARQQELDVVRQIFQGFPMIPALKAAIAHWSRIDAWQRVRPPLVELDDGQHAKLIRQLEAVGFSIAGLQAA
ncbi:MAG TPA: dihydrodipicolinate synthase family protein [Bordetella sp.]